MLRPTIFFIIFMVFKMQNLFDTDQFLEKTLVVTKESFKIQNRILLTTCRCFDTRFDEFRFLDLTIK